MRLQTFRSDIGGTSFTYSEAAAKATIAAIRTWIEGMSPPGTNPNLRVEFRRAIEIALAVWISGGIAAPLHKLDEETLAALVSWANIHSAKHCKRKGHVGVPTHIPDAAYHLDDPAAMQLYEFVHTAASAIVISVWRSGGVEGTGKAFAEVVFEGAENA